MIPAQLSPATFAGYGPAAKSFATTYLPLLRRLPLAICPSFVQQVQAIDTSFPVERDSLRWQCDALQSMPTAQFAQLIAPLSALPLSEELRASDWVHAPAAFVADLTAYLWSSGTMPTFRTAAHDLFAAIPTRPDDSQRLVIVLMGQGASADPKNVLRKLRKRGVFLTSLETASAPAQMAEVLRAHTESNPAPYASWYVDGGVPRSEFASKLRGTIEVSYPELAPLRGRVLGRMQATIASGTAGAELMRSRLAETTAHDVGAAELTADPVLGRFYTELFTLSSGPQVFSTSFVQWTGRELARRVQPQTLLLRYAPRQQHHDLNELFAKPDAGAVDPQASLRDAEMGAYLNWVEMSRITAPGNLTFAAVVEGQPYAAIVGPKAPANSTYDKPLSFEKALHLFAGSV